MLIGIDASRAVIGQRTGTEIYSLYLIRALLEVGAAHRFRLYLNAAPFDGLFPDVPHCERRAIPFPRLWTHVRLSAEMLRDPPDVLYVPAHVLPIVHPPCSVVTVHDLGHRYHPRAHTSAQRRYLEWSTRYHVRTAAHIVADSQSTRDDLVRLYGADRARITVAYLGIRSDLARVCDRSAIANVRKKYGIGEPYLLYVGTLQPRKNLVRLIEAFAEMDEHPVSPAVMPALPGQRADRELQLVLAGKRGWLYGEILERAQELGIGERVIFPGFVDDADLPVLYSGARAFVMPSLYEGFCMPVLEAMACGVPVACSSTSSLAELTGEAALTFDPCHVGGMAAALVRVAGDGAVRERLIARGYDRAKQFTWERCAREVLGALERTYGRGP